MNDTLLRRVLEANTAISAVWGLTAVVGAPALAEPLGIAAVPIAAVGVVTLVAAILFRLFGSRPVLRPAEGLMAAVGDLAFGSALAASAALLPEVTALGRVLVAGSGAAVVVIGILEVAGTRRLYSS